MGLKSGSGAASVADQELPEHVECSLEASHAFFEAVHAVAETHDIIAQPLGVLARGSVQIQIEHGANDKRRSPNRRSPE